jgi:hypothetical protein
LSNTYALGHFVRFTDDEDTVKLSLQNFFIGQNITHNSVSYLFSPFGFSGTSVNRQGDLEPAALIFPNNDIARAYLSDALRGETYQGSPQENRRFRNPWLARVEVCLVNFETKQVASTLFTYAGQATAGGWDDTTLEIELSSVIDAAVSDVPTRTTTRRQVGSLPTTSTLSLR